MTQMDEKSMSYTSKNVVPGLWLLSSLTPEVLHVAKEHLKVSHLMMVFSGDANLSEEHTKSLQKVSYFNW
jgi:hypothetical protein